METKVYRLNKSERVIILRALWDHVEKMIKGQKLYEDNEELLEMYNSLEERTRRIIKKLG